MFFGEAGNGTEAQRRGEDAVEARQAKEEADVMATLGPSILVMTSRESKRPSHVKHCLGQASVRLVARSYTLPVHATSVMVAIEGCCSSKCIVDPNSFRWKQTKWGPFRADWRRVLQRTMR